MGHALVAEASALTVDCHTSLCIHGHPKGKGKEGLQMPLLVPSFSPS